MYLASVNQGSSTRFSKASLHHLKVSAFSDAFEKMAKGFLCACVFLSLWDYQQNRPTRNNNKKIKTKQNDPESVCHSFILVKTSF